eukprot:gene17517-19267_t
MEFVTTTRTPPWPIVLLATSLALILTQNEVRCDLFDSFKDTGSKNSNNKLKKNQSVTLKKLDYSYRKLKKIPTAEIQYHSDTLEFLDLGENMISKINLGDFPYLPKLHTLILRKNRIREIDGTTFGFLPNLLVLRIEDNLLDRIPRITMPLRLYDLDIAYNRIQDIAEEDLKSCTLLETLILKGNKIEVLGNNRFSENKKLTTLDLSENPLKLLESESLVGPKKLRSLFLQETQISKIPEKGIKHLYTLKISGIEELWSVPDPSVFVALKEVEVTYSVHCCPFRGLHTAETKPDAVMSCAEYLARKQAAMTPTKRAATTEFNKREVKNISNPLMSVLKMPKSFPLKLSFGKNKKDNPFADIMKSFKKTNATSRPLCSESNDTHAFVPPARRVKCTPSPDAFNPCDDVIGTTFLRVFSWASSLLAIFGNIFLLLVLYSNESQLTVYKLLMYHLAVANAIMGLYLGILCSVDAFTFHRYYNYVRLWQYSGGCKVAGFLAVFSTELSVCILAIVTVERYLLIVHALHIRRQMNLVHAKIALTIAWAYSFGVAILPVTNVVSSYEKVAICLPFESSSKLSEGYIAWLLLYYVLSFVYIVLSYFKMYTTVNGAPSCSGVNTEFKVAKRFSMIVFCNFGCWVPISVAGYLAMYSNVKMSIDVSKFLLVFAFPLNACTNPFLYAFFTKIFRGDVLHFLSKLGILKESSRRYSSKSAYLRGRHGSRASEVNTSTSGVTRFSPPGTLKSVINFNKKSPTHTFQSLSSPATSSRNPGAKAKEIVYHNVNIEAGGVTDVKVVPQDQPKQPKKPSGLQSVLNGLWALTTGKRNRNESTSSTKELLSSFDPERYARARSVSEALEIACHDDELMEKCDAISADKMSPDTDVTNL